jgi:hypothetical protein
MNNDERVLWTNDDVECVMISCCSGAELQVRRVGSGTDGEILLRELYPTKSDLYERAGELRNGFAIQSPTTQPSRS